MSFFWLLIINFTLLIDLDNEKCSKYKVTGHQKVVDYNAPHFLPNSIMKTVKLTSYRVSLPLVLMHVVLITALTLAMVMSLPSISMTA